MGQERSTPDIFAMVTQTTMAATSSTTSAITELITNSSLGNIASAVKLFMETSTCIERLVLDEKWLY
jgi:hypothetical protein